MVADRISVRVDSNLRRRLEEQASVMRKSESNLVREALEAYLQAHGKPVSVYDLAVKAGIIGMARGLPRDLSTNRKYFKGFGR